MPLLRVVFGVVAGDRGVLVPVEDLEDPRLLLALGFLLFDLDQALLRVGWTLVGHPPRMPVPVPI
jgi:hypothetical protein